MKDATGNVLTGEPAADLMDIALTIDGKAEAPTREEFFTNYPFSSTGTRTTTRS
jgi:hypothetical protein